MEIAKSICEIIDNLLPIQIPRTNLIKFVEDRPGHDKRYAIDNSKIKNILKWQPNNSFNESFQKTIKWYLNNRKWCNRVMQNAKYDGGRIGNKKI